MPSATDWGWREGANEANTGVGFLPRGWGVPVLPATHTLSNGKPPKAPAAVPWVTTPASALRMYASVRPETGRCLITGGVIFFDTLPGGGATSALPLPGRGSRPPLVPAA